MKSHVASANRSSSRQNALILFSRVPQINRTDPSEPYAALPWDDLDALFTAILGDVVEHAFETGEIDILLYRNSTEFSDDFLQSFGNRLRFFEFADEPVEDHVPAAIEQAFALHYSRVVVLLENHPLLGPNFLSKLFSQLTCEDDCIVVGQTLEGRMYLLGMKSNHAALFDSSARDFILKPDLLFRGVCREDALVFHAPSQYLLDSGANLARLRLDIEEMQESTLGFPRRTFVMFQSFDKKYKPRKPTR